MTTRHTHSDKSIDDILQSINNVISNRENSAKNRETLEDAIEDELHLTEIIDEILEEQEFLSNELMSDEVRSKTESILEDFIETATTLGMNSTETETVECAKNTPIEGFIIDLLRPQLREWLDVNLPSMVKQIVSEEIKALVANIRKSKP